MIEVPRSLGNWSEIAPGDAREVAPIFPVIENMNADEVLALYRELEDDEHAVFMAQTIGNLDPGKATAHYSLLDDEERAAYWKGQTVDPRRYEKLLEPLRRYTEWVPRYDIVRARELYLAFANSTDSRDRSWLAISITNLPPYDHELGVALCRRLLCDSDYRVRSAAYESVIMPLIEERDNLSLANDYISEFGLTWQDAFYLHMDYREVQYGDVYH